MKIRMNVLVTGVAGFLGSHIAKACRDKGDFVIGIDDLSCGSYMNIPGDTEFIEADCCNLHPEVFQDIDLVYHCAALAHEGLSVFSPSRITRSIFEASVRVFSCAIEAGVKRIVYCSSMARYGWGEPPYEEHHEPEPVDPYGIAKLAAERVLDSLYTSHEMDFVIAVPHNIIGPRQKYDDPYRNVAAIFANRMLQGNQPIIYGDGEQQRCFSDIRDVLPCFLEMGTARVSNHTFNIGPDEEIVTINQLAREIADIIDFRLDPIYVPVRPREVKEAWCSSQKARDYLGYETKHSLRETLESIVEWVDQNGPRPFVYHLPIEIQKGCPETWLNKQI